MINVELAVLFWLFVSTLTHNLKEVGEKDDGLRGSGSVGPASE